MTFQQSMEPLARDVISTRGHSTNISTAMELNLYIHLDADDEEIPDVGLVPAIPPIPKTQHEAFS